MKQYKNNYVVPAKWLSSLPSHWACKKIGSLFLERKTKVSDKDYPPLSVTKIGVVPQLTTAVKTDAGDNRKLVCAGDFVINSRSDRKGACGIADRDGSVALINIVLTPKEEWNRKYVHYLLRCQLFAEEYYHYGRGIVADLWTTRFSEMKNILIPVPPRSEQEQIVCFLDWKISKINQLINIKQREIKAINSLKYSMVNNVILNGVSKNVSMKYSGVKWLGDIPAHWDVIKLRQILNPISVKNHSELPLLSVVREQGVIIRDVKDTNANHNFIPDDLSGYKMVRRGQFVINKMKAWQGSYGISDYTGIVSPAYFVFNVVYDNLEYFHYVIRSNIYVNFFAQASDGIRVGQWDLQMDKMKEIPFIIPPKEEQVSIVKNIKKRLLEYDKIIEKLFVEIENLQELRARLISDVVTGKMDVRDIIIPEYEYVEEKNSEEVEDTINEE